jgi:hypothetical protein
MADQARPTRPSRIARCSEPVYGRALWQATGGDHPMNHDQRAAALLLRLCLRPDGTLPRTPLLAAAARAALVADLALAGAVTSTDTALEVDTGPTGFAPADNLLRRVVDRPDKSLGWWLRRGPDCIHDVIDYLLHTQTWSARHATFGHRYRDNDPAAVEAAAHQVDAALSGQDSSAHTAVLAAIIGAVGSTQERGGRLANPTLLHACGPAEWLIGDIVSYLLQQRALLNAAAADAQAALAINFLQ